jgi:hypothetical protein
MDQRRVYPTLAQVLDFFKDDTRTKYVFAYYKDKGQGAANGATFYVRNPPNICDEGSECKARFSNSSQFGTLNIAYEAKNISELCALARDFCRFLVDPKTLEILTPYLEKASVNLYELTVDIASMNIIELSMNGSGMGYINIGKREIEKHSRVRSVFVKSSPEDDTKKISIPTSDVFAPDGKAICPYTSGKIYEALYNYGRVTMKERSIRIRITEVKLIEFEDNKVVTLGGKRFQIVDAPQQPLQTPPHEYYRPPPQVQPAYIPAAFAQPTYRAESVYQTVPPQVQPKMDQAQYMPPQRQEPPYMPPQREQPFQPYHIRHN